MLPFRIGGEKENLRIEPELIQNLDNVSEKSVSDSNTSNSSKIADASLNNAIAESNKSEKQIGEKSPLKCTDLHNVQRKLSRSLENYLFDDVSIHSDRQILLSYDDREDC